MKLAVVVLAGAAHGYGYGSHNEGRYWGDGYGEDVGRRHSDEYSGDFGGYVGHDRRPNSAGFNGRAFHGSNGDAHQRREGTHSRPGSGSPLVDPQAMMDMLNGPAGQQLKESFSNVDMNELLSNIDMSAVMKQLPQMMNDPTFKQVMNDPALREMAKQFQQKHARQSGGRRHRGL